MPIFRPGRPIFLPPLGGPGCYSEVIAPTPIRGLGGLAVDPWADFSMLSVIIPTLNSERVLVPTLGMLVSGAMSGIVREVSIADGGSTDATLKIADVAGCTVLA